MARQLPCIAGRREFNRGRYMIRIAKRDTVTAIFEEFKTALRSGKAVACLYVFNDERFYQGVGNVKDAFHFLAKQMEPISKLPAQALATGAPLTNAVSLPCPVTGKQTVFDDFECIAFCPQSDDREDRLYDPLMAMPYPSVNMSSDVFAFSRFVSDSAESSLGHPPQEESDFEAVERVFDLGVQRWQRVATTTIRNYESLTDTQLCPVHVTEDDQYWIAGHKDPAFAEEVKEVHRHELPVLYGKRIADGWLAHLRDGVSYQATGLARDGIPV